MRGVRRFLSSRPSYAAQDYISSMKSENELYAECRASLMSVVRSDFSAAHDAFRRMKALGCIPDFGVYASLIFARPPMEHGINLLREALSIGYASSLAPAHFNAVLQMASVSTTPPRALSIVEMMSKHGVEPDDNLYQLCYVNDL